MSLDDLVLSVRNQLPGQSPRAWGEQAHVLGQHIARSLIDHELGTWLEREVRPQDLVYCGVDATLADALLQPPMAGTYLQAWRHLEEVRGAGLHLANAELDDRFTASVQLTRRFGPYVIVSVGYAHTSNLSNIDFFEYDRNIWTVALTGRF